MGVSDLTEDQIAEFKEAFDLFDKSRSGNVLIKDLPGVILSMGRTPPERDLKELVVESSPGSGAIDFTGFLDLISKRFWSEDDADDVEALVLSTFCSYDKEGTGFIEAPLFKHVLGMLGESISDRELDELTLETSVGYWINYEEYVKNEMKLK